jgi:ribonucleoside-diphosphate reductase alpha chain
MGWADALIRLGLPYDSHQAVKLATEVSRFITATAWSYSARLAVEKGPFPEWERSALKNRLPYPVRNSNVTTIAPTGTISLLAGCSSGIEPHYALASTRRVLWKSTGASQVILECVPALRKELEAKMTPALAEVVLCELASQPHRAAEILNTHGIDARRYRTAMDIPPLWHVKHQAAWQDHVTNGVSKTINLPATATVEDVSEAFKVAYRLGCKGITIYRNGSRSLTVLSTGTCPSCAGELRVEGGCSKCDACGWGVCER